MAERASSVDPEISSVSGSAKMAGMSDQQTDRAERRRWQTDPTADYSVGPDDAGNIVMHGIGLVVSAWRALVSKIRGH